LEGDEVQKRVPEYLGKIVVIIDLKGQHGDRFPKPIFDLAYASSVFRQLPNSAGHAGELTLEVRPGCLALKKKTFQARRQEVVREQESVVRVDERVLSTVKDVFAANQVLDDVDRHSDPYIKYDGPIF